MAADQQTNLAPLPYERWLSPKEVGTQIGVAKATVLRWHSEGCASLASAFIFPSRWSTVVDLAASFSTRSFFPGSSSSSPARTEHLGRV
jgi:hypothetical protein